jgi:hypothetical protein
VSDSTSGSAPPGPAKTSEAPSPAAYVQGGFVNPPPRRPPHLDTATSDAPWISHAAAQAQQVHHQAFAPADETAYYVTPQRNALLSTLGTTAPPPQTLALEARSTAVARGGAAVTTTPSGATGRRAFERQLTERPADIRDAARALAEVVQGEIDRLNASTPNDPEELTRHNELVAFLGMVAGELRKLVDALSLAIEAAKTSPDQEPMFLGRAGQIAEQLQIGFDEFLEKNRAYVAGYLARAGLFAGVFAFLQACGVGAEAASIASAILNASLPKQK